MTGSVDTRVTELKFNNGQFEAEAKKTLGTLDGLQQKLNFKDAGKGFGDLAAAASKIDIGGVGRDADSVSARISAMSVVAIAALASIANKAIEAGATLVRSLSTDNISEGFDDYNQKLISVQTVMNSTGKSINYVGKYFNQLDKYADDTVYNLTDMTSALAKFTNAGVNLKTAVPAIKGIGNMTALAGQGALQAQIAYYNLSQSIAGGFLTRTDFKSLELANVATKSFRMELIKTAVAAGTIKKTGKDMYQIKGVKGAMKGSELFTEGLQHQWATAKVLTNTLKRYGDETKGIGKKAAAAATEVRSLPMMMETLKAQVGTGWTDTFEILLGNVKESKKLFTELTTAVGGVLDGQSKARNKFLGDWKKAGGRTALIDALRNSVQALWQVLTPIGDAWNDVFPPASGKNLANLIKGFRDWTKTLKMGAKDTEAIKIIASALFTVLKGGVAVLKYIGSGFLLVAQLGAKLLGILAQLMKPVQAFVAGLTGDFSPGDSLNSFIDQLIALREKALQPLLAFLDVVRDHLSTLFSGGGGSGAAGFTASLQPLYAFGERIRALWINIGDTIKAVWDWTKQAGERIKAMVTGFGAGAGGTFAKIWDMVKQIAKGVMQFVNDFKKGASEALKGVDLNTVLAALNTGIFVSIIMYLKKFTDAGLDFGGALKKGILEGIEELTNTLKAMQTSLKADALKSIAVAIILFAGAIYILAQVDPERLMSSAIGLGVVFTALLGSLKVLEKVSSSDSVNKMPYISASLILLSTAMLILAKAVQIMGMLSWEELTKGLIGMAVGLGALMGAVVIMSKYQGAMIKAGIGLILLATAMMLLVKPIQMLGTMKPETLKQGGEALAALMGGALLFAALASKSEGMIKAGAAMLMMAAAINALVPPILILGIVPWPVLLQGITVLGLVLAGLIVAVNQLQSSVAGAAAMILIAVALNMLLVPIVALGLIPWQVVVQGLATVGIALVMLVAAANMMTSALPGAAATIALAGAMLVMAMAIGILGAMDPMSIVTALGAIAGALVILGVAAAVMAPVIPAMLGLSGAVALLGVGIMAIGAGLMLLSVGLMMLGPAAAVGSAGLQMLGAAAVSLAANTLQIAAIGAAFVVLGAGIMITGAAVMVLGVGLILMGTGLALVAATGAIGAIGLLAVVNVLKQLIWDVPAMMALGAAFAVLGAGLVVTGVGALALGAGVIVLGVGMLILVGVGATASAVMDMFGNAISKASSYGPALGVLGNNLQIFGGAAMTTAVGLAMAASSMRAATAAVSSGTKAMTAGIKTMSTEFDKLEPAVGKSLDKTKNTVNKTLNSMAKDVGDKGKNVGVAILNGMVRGLNSSNKVSDAARRVAKKALDAAKDELDSHSPSREFEKLGAFSVEGMAVGFSDNSGMAEKASRGVARNTIEAMRETLSKAGSSIDSNIDMAPTIRPVLDLSDVTRTAGDISKVLNGNNINLGSIVNTSAAVQGRQTAFSDGVNTVPVTNVTNNFDYTQNNTSPKALSTSEIYRNTNNQIAQIKKLVNA